MIIVAVVDGALPLEIPMSIVLLEKEGPPRSAAYRILPGADSTDVSRTINDNHAAPRDWHSPVLNLLPVHNRDDE